MFHLRLHRIRQKTFLNILDDDCIDEIFRRVENLENFLNMAEVCQRFHKSAKSCFRIKYSLSNDGNVFRSVEISHRYSHKSVSAERANKLFTIFGFLINCLYLVSTSDQERDNEIFK